MNLFLKYRKIFIVAVHATLFALAYCFSFALRFDMQIPDYYITLIFDSLPWILLVKLLIFEYFDLYQGWWRYVSMHDLTQIIKASFVSALAVLAIGYMLFVRQGFPRSIPIIDFILTVAMVGGSRFLVRAFKERRLLLNFVKDRNDFHRVLIIGAGDAGETLAREIIKHPEMKYQVAGFLDDSPYKTNSRIHGFRVLGGVSDVNRVCKEHEVEEIIIAIPSATGEQMRRVVGLCEETGLKIKTIPGLDRLIDGRITVSQIREVEIEDLLGRKPVELDKEAIGLYLHGKNVLVTGAAGSIGSEICRQVLSFGPRELVLVDQNENGIFDMNRELLKLTTRASLRFFVADVTSEARMEHIFRQVQPEVIFHAAAYKHVPVMEENPGEAVRNNVLGTKVLADLCVSTGCVNRFVMISTDKAVNPTSVMGATKRIAERYVQRLSAKSETKFITVRFGNVLGSMGSVIPIFKEQIQKGGPVCITHPDMIRYFMTIPEASQLVLQAGSMGEGGEIFVLDMGEPVRIIDLAETLIKLSGLKPHVDIDVKFTGIRPGEKLFEELRLDSEEVVKTGHAKVFVHSACADYPADFDRSIRQLVQKADKANEAELRQMLSDMIPEYSPSKVVPMVGKAQSAAEFLAIRKRMEGGEQSLPQSSLLRLDDKKPKP